MTTHLVKSYKEPTMEEMQGMLKLLVEDHKRREEEVAAERMKREAEFEKERTRLKERGKDESEGQKNRWKSCMLTWSLLCSIPVAFFYLG